MVVCVCSMWRSYLLMSITEKIVMCHKSSSFSKPLVSFVTALYWGCSYLLGKLAKKREGGRVGARQVGSHKLSDCRFCLLSAVVSQQFQSWYIIPFSMLLLSLVSWCTYHRWCNYLFIHFIRLWRQRPHLMFLKCYCFIKELLWCCPLRWGNLEKNRFWRKRIHYEVAIEKPDEDVVGS